MIQKWIEALRSGKYVQGRLALQENGKFCCLGVAADIMDCKWESYNDIFMMADGAVSSLTDEHLERLGITRDQQFDLMTMNDSGKSFSEIADWIERNV